MSVGYPINDPPLSNSFAAGGCIYPQPSYQYQWIPPQTVETTVTETCEYDEDGRLIKKTTTTTTVTRGGYYNSTSPYAAIYGSEV